jgi:hypothetical protein
VAFFEESIAAFTFCIHNGTVTPITHMSATPALRARGNGTVYPPCVKAAASQT